MSYYRLQQTLKAAGYYTGQLDNLWGEKSQRAFDAMAGDAAKWRSYQISLSPNRTLTATQLGLIASEYNLTVHHLKAVIAVESNGGWFEDVRNDILDLDGPGGFLDGPDLPKILFEAHWFSKFTNHAFDKTHPQISSPVWNRSLYKGGQTEYIRLYTAMDLDRTAALKATSWGLFQIMGFNFDKCGFKDVEEMVKAMKTSEYEHLQAFLKFCENQNLIVPLREKDWAKFARGYNGPAYATLNYHGKLAHAYQISVQKEQNHVS